MSAAPCPVCQSSKTRFWRNDIEDFEYGVQPVTHYALWRCEACASGFLWPRPDPEVMASFYPDDYHAYHDDHGAVASLLVGMRSRARAAYYARMAPGQGRLFDVGAGDCRHFDAIREYSQLTFSGVDLKPEMVEKARARGYDVTLGMLETMDITPHVGQYDIVSMNHVVEHVLDPDLLLKRALALLKPGGYVVGQLPTSSCWELSIFGRYWGGHHYPRHLQAISREGLADALTRAGFTGVRVMSVPHVQTSLSLQNWLVGHGWKPRMKFGKTPIYNLLLLVALPFEAVAYAAGRCGIVNFEARRPV
jgi:SAM-dependent methyltransferase